MSATIASLFFKYLAGAVAGMALIGGANLALGATWPEVRAAVPGYVVSALVAAVVITAYAVWKQRRSTAG